MNRKIVPWVVMSLVVLLVVVVGFPMLRSARSKPDPFAPKPVPKVLGLDECATSDDCQLVRFEGCCGGPCCPVPHAVTKAHAEKGRRACMEVKCAQQTCTAVDQLCPVAPLIENLKALCENKVCVAVPK